MSAKATLLSVFLLVLTTTASVAWAGGAKGSVLRSAPAVSSPAFRPVIEFGHKGGNLRPYRIGIDAGGHVKVLAGRPQLKVESIPAEKVEELLREASDDTFWKTSAEEDAQAKKILPDFGFVFVRVRAPGGRSIYHQGRYAGPLGRFYDQLSEFLLA
jgi:hypothetical protein